MMPAETSVRNSGASVMEFRWLTNSQSAAPPIRPIGSGERPSNTRAPVQVTANEVKRIAFDKSMVKTSGSVPYIPNRVIDPARSRCADPHHATA